MYAALCIHDQACLEEQGFAPGNNMIVLHADALAQNTM